MRGIGKICALLAGLLLVVGNAFAQSQKLEGVPRIIHYTKKDFNSDPQVWTMCQGRDGILYFGNNEGVLVFDGERWQKVKLPNSSSVRSLLAASDGQIYAGGFNELGVVRRDDRGLYYYESLTTLLRAEDRNMENVWQIHEVGDYIFFRSFKKLIAIAGTKAVTLPTMGTYWFATVINGRYYVHDHEGFKRVDVPSMQFEPVVFNAAYNNQEVLTLLPGFDGKGLLLLTKKGAAYTVDETNGTATFARQLIADPSTNLVLCALRSREGRYYIGTLSSKIILLDQSGKEIISNEAFQSLQDNTVLNLFESNDGNIWALLNNGIDCINVSSPLSIIFEQASVFDVLFAADRFYLATNQGVFAGRSDAPATLLSAPDTKKVAGLEGQAWSMQHFENSVLCSHDRGLFEVVDNKAVRIPGVTGVWKVIPVAGKQHAYFACTYEGIFLMTFTPGDGFVIQHRIEGFDESSRDILQTDEPGVFWVCHGYKGVFRIRINDDLKRVLSLEHFDEQSGLPSRFNINVFRWKDDIVFTTNQGIFTFVQGNGKFEPHPFLNQLFGTARNVRKLLQHGDRTWFVHDDEAGYFNTDDAAPALHRGLFLSLKGTFNQGMECIVPHGPQQVLLGTITGLYAFDLSYNTPHHENSSVLITKINVTGSGENGTTTQLPLQTSAQLGNDVSGIQFYFAAPQFHDRANIQFSVKLEPLDEKWSAWQEQASKELNYLRPGKYVFKVKAQSLLGETAGESEFNFEVLPAWYQTRLAYIAYVVVSLVLLIVIWKLVSRKIRLEKRKTREEEEKKRKVLELELQQIRLEREKRQIIKDKEQLEEDVIFKSKELANYTMLLVKKRELLSEMNEELKNLKEHLRNDPSRQIVRDLTKKINANLENEEHIQVFEANFERVHHEFFTQLKSTFPDLNQKELQLCAFVRMNLTNKEIASILNISVRGVETARYRLRKRLGMSQEQDMAAFLEKLYSSAAPHPES